MRDFLCLRERRKNQEYDLPQGRPGTYPELQSAPEEMASLQSSEWGSSLQEEHRFLYCCSLFSANRMPVRALQSLMGPILAPGTSPQTSFLGPLVEGIGHLPS